MTTDDATKTVAMTAQTLEEIEDDAWPDPPADSSGLVRTVHAVRRIPLDQADARRPADRAPSAGRIRGAGATALDFLESDPLTEGDLHPGDLLSAVLRQPEEFWRAHPDQATRLDAVLAVLQRDDATVGDSLWASLTEKVAAYRAHR